MSPEAVNPLWGSDWPEVRASWSFDPAIAHLNHGAFGGVPREIQGIQRRIRDQVEANPNRFYTRALYPLLDEAHQRVAAFLGCDPAGVALVANATQGISLAVRAVALSEDDEILVTDHAYPAVLSAAADAARRSGARVKTVAIALPEAGTAQSDAEDHIVGTVMAAVSDRTVLAVVDQITSPTGMRLPARRLCAELRSQGVLSLVDGAHAPATLAEGPALVHADFWVGNFHKWACSPRAVTALVVHPDQRRSVRPLAPSSDPPADFPANLIWQGAGDYSAYLCVPPTLDFLADLGWERIRTHNRALVRAGARCVSEALGTTIAVPEPLFEAMALVGLPSGVATDRIAARALACRIGEEASTEVTVVAWGGRGWLRLSAHAYNHPGEYDALAATLPQLLS